MLAVTDQEIEFFKNDVEKFNDIEKQIKDLKEKIKPYQAKIKELTQKKKEKQEEVLNFMESNDLDVANVGDSSLELKNTSVTKSVSKADVYDRLYKYFSELYLVNKFHKPFLLTKVSAYGKIFIYFILKTLLFFKFFKYKLCNF